MVRKPTAINRVQKRVDDDYKKLEQVTRIYEPVVKALDQQTVEFHQALKDLEEAKKKLLAVYRATSAGVGMLREGAELLQELIHGSRDTALLATCLIKVFMEADYSILLQALMALDPPLRREAFKKLTPEFRKQLLEELSDDE